MESDIQQPKQKGFHPKHKQLFVDAILIVLSVTIPHSTIPLAGIAVVRIAIDLYQLKKRKSEDKSE